MAKKTLTLHLDERTIRQAKELAGERGLSVSALFTNWIQAMDASNARKRRPLAPITRQVLGLVKLSPEDQHKSDRQLVEQALIRRCGLDDRE